MPGRLIDRLAIVWFWPSNVPVNIPLTISPTGSQPLVDQMPAALLPAVALALMSATSLYWPPTLAPIRAS